MKRMSLLLALCALALSGCPTGGLQSNRSPLTSETSKDPQIAALRKSARELAQLPEEKAEFVQVQHILISFGGAGTAATRSKEEAEKLAAQIFAKIQGGSDFAALVRDHTDDSPPGIYGMVSEKSKENRGQLIYWRHDMARAFGNVGWRLKVGEVGVAAYDAKDSPYGWHIVKRLK